MRRTLHVATVVLVASIFAPACLLNAGPYESAGGGGTSVTTSSGGSTGGTTNPGGGGAAGSTGATGGTGGSADPCGNGTLDTGEECDDGPANDDSGDCTSACKISMCGDGLVNTLGSTAKREECDDENTVDTDDCTAKCTIAVCGDGVINKDGSPAKREECDDNNMANGDGCDSTCKVPCGDNITYGSEQCDDGNPNGSDGCSATCQIEKACNNGRVDPDEECDGGADCTSCVIDPQSACGKAFEIVPVEMNGVRKATVEGKNSDMDLLTPNGEVLNPMCADPHHVMLYRWKTGDRGSFVTANTKSAIVDGQQTFQDTTLWIYRDCANKRAEEGCSDDAPGLGLYSKVQTGYLPPHTTLYIVVGGAADGDIGTFSVDIVEQPVTLFFGTTFDADLSGMTTTDSGMDGTWIQCTPNQGACTSNTTKSWSGGGLATINDGFENKNHAGENLTTPNLDMSVANVVWSQINFDFSDKGGQTDRIDFNYSQDGTTYLLGATQATNLATRRLEDVSIIAAHQAKFSIQMRYDDGGATASYVRVDDIYLFGY